MPRTGRICRASSAGCAHARIYRPLEIPSSFYFPRIDPPVVTRHEEENDKVRERSQDRDHHDKVRRLPGRDIVPQVIERVVGDVGVALGSTKPAKNTPGGKILVYGNVTVGETATWTAPNGVILADANATLVVPSGATVPVPTTTVPRHVVKATTVDGTTTYSVVAKGFFFMTY